MAVSQLSSKRHNVTLLIAEGELQSRGRRRSMAIEPPGKAGEGTPVDIPVTKDGDGPTDDKIRERAHLIWIDEGRPDGRELDHWMRAKWEIEQDPHP
jgi:hypothetical protein